MRLMCVLFKRVTGKISVFIIPHCEIFLKEIKNANAQSTNASAV